MSKYRYVDANETDCVRTVRRYRTRVRQARLDAGLSICNMSAVQMKRAREQTLPLRGTKPKHRRINIMSGTEVVGQIQELTDEQKARQNWKDGKYAVYYYSVRGFFCRAQYCSEEKCRFGSVFEAKRHAEARLEELIQADRKNNKASIRPSRPAPVTMLPAGDGSEFYPTPMAVAGRMFGKIKWDGVYTVLEPSAGKGDLLEALDRYKGGKEKDNAKEIDVDCLEIDDNLRAILKDRGWRTVGEDFFDFQTVKKYDAIIMNPPFSCGDKHLLRAISLLERNGGGQIVCLLNENTIKNPYTSTRKALQSKLDQYGAKCDFLHGAFKKAERKSDVDTVIVSLTVPEPLARSRILEFLEKAQKAKTETDAGPITQEVARRSSDWLEQMVLDYEIDVSATVRFLREYAGIREHLHGLYLNYDNKTQKVEINSRTINEALKNVREVYWRKLLNDKRFEMLVGKLTSNMYDEYRRNIGVFSNCDFSRDNIKKLVLELQGQLNMGIKAELLKLFETFTAYDLREDSDHIHYFNGWKTNNCYKVGKRCIVPMDHAFGYESSKLSEYEVKKFLDDIQKVLDFLDRGQTDWGSNLSLEIAIANSHRSGFRKVETHYFYATFYKKGTVHVSFKPEMMHVIDRLNIFAAMEKTWLPPYYGKVRYEEMDEEGKSVINSFHGDVRNPQEEYAKVVKNPENYLTRVENTLKLLESEKEGGAA